jgi:hypothetical protein
MFLGVIITRHGEDEVGTFRSFGDPEYGTREENSVRAGRGESFEFTGGGGVDLV